jgi:ubiquinone/menaquinone biosynthesis C-methylase UbiE
MDNKSYTRGSGLLEGFLAKQRASKANSFIAEKLRKGKILDIGCGSYPYFLINTKFNEKFGIDPSIKQTLVSKEKVNLTKESLDKKLPYQSNNFNVVTMLAVFEHLENKNLVPILSEIERVLCNNGLLIITTPAPWSDKLLHFMARTGLISKEEIHEHKHNLSKKVIEDLINKAGFKKEKIRSGYFEFGFNMWFVVSK